MMVIRALRAAALTIALVASGATTPSWAQEVGRQPVGATFQEPSPQVPESLQETYRQLADSWRLERAGAVAQLARDGRVYVVVQRQGVSQRLAANQLQYLLDEMFDATDGVEFRFPAYTVYDAKRQAGYAVGERVYREGPGEDPRTERVFVGTRSEHGRWVMTELRLTDE